MLNLGSISKGSFQWDSNLGHINPWLNALYLVNHLFLAMTYFSASLSRSTTLKFELSFFSLLPFLSQMRLVKKIINIFGS